MRLPIALAVLLATGAAAAQKLGPVDWIFLVDTSQSMRGIFPDVQASLGTFVSEANDGDSVAIYAFDRDVRLHSAMTIDAKSRADLKSIIGALEANGKRTHLGAAIEQGLERAATLPKDGTRTRAVVLFTDGKEDVRGIANPTKIDANLAAAGDAYIFFVSMGEHEPQLDVFAAQAPRATVLKETTAEAIRAVATKIRATIPPPPEPPAPRPIATTVTPPPLPPPPPPPSWFEQALRVAIPVALLAAIAIAFVLHHRKQNRLEGELEILHPIAADSFIGLPKLRTSEVALSAILPIDVGGSDARLFVRRKAGRKKVCISARDGSLRINDVATPETELYDADIIQIGDAKLRFNRVGDERQEELS